MIYVTGQLCFSCNFLLPHPLQQVEKEGYLVVSDIVSESPDWGYVIIAVTVFCEPQVSGFVSFWIANSRHFIKITNLILQIKTQIAGRENFWWADAIEAGCARVESTSVQLLMMTEWWWRTVIFANSEATNTLPVLERFWLSSIIQRAFYPWRLLRRVPTGLILMKACRCFHENYVALLWVASLTLMTARELFSVLSLCFCLFIKMCHHFSSEKWFWFVHDMHF